jgi:hypothetical protein
MSAIFPNKPMLDITFLALFVAAASVLFLLVME